MQESDDLIYRYLDRDLDVEGCEQLAVWLAEDAANTRRFALLANEQYQVRELTRQLVFPPTVETQAELLRSLLSMEEAADAETVTWHAPKPVRKPRPRVAHVGPQATPRVLVIPRWMVAGSLVAAAAVVMLLVLRPAPSGPVVTPPPRVAVEQSPAVVEASRGAAWSALPGWSGGRGDRLPTGQIKLTHGEVTLRFDGGARVVLTAPCVFTVEDARALRLATGRAVVQSSPWETGFAVATPHQRIIDRDTTFGVEAQARTTQVQVFRGAVDLYTPGVGRPGGDPVAQASVLQAFETRSGGMPESSAFDVDRYRTVASAELLPVITRRTVVFREGEQGYHGTADTWFSSRTNPPETIGAATGNYLRIGRWSTANQQALVRFDGLIGPGRTQIPAGAKVERAELLLYTASDIRDSFGNASPQGDAFAAYQMLTRWDERDAYGDAPWSAGDTPQVDTDGREAVATPSGDCASQREEASGYIIPANTQIVIDVTGPVSAWAQGDANHGLLLQSLGSHPDAPTAQAEGDAIFVASSEYATNPSRRPAIEVTYLVVGSANP